MSVLNSGPLATLLTRLSAARAAYLDAAISSRAPSSTALSDATWTNARAAKLDNLDAAVSTAGAQPPITSGLKGRGNANADLVNFANQCPLPELGSASQSSYDTWTTVVSDTGSGVIEFLSVYVTANANDRNTQARLSIDGNVVWASDTNAWQTASHNDDGFYLVGFSDGNDELAFGSLPFASSFTLEFKKTENNSGTVTCASKGSYYLTG